MGMQYLYNEFRYLLRTFRFASYCRFVHLITLLLIPSLIFYPQSDIFAQIHEFSDDFEIQESQLAFTYDDVLDLIEKVESGTFSEKDFTSEELDKLNYFMCRLAYEGAFEEDMLQFATLFQDSQDLFVDDIQPSLADTLYYCTLESTLDSDVPVMSALAYGRPDIMLCKSHKHKSVWQKTKAYVKKHKKAIIAGAVVVTMAIMALLNAQNKESTCPHRNNKQSPEPLAIVDTVIAKNSPLNEPDAQIELQAIRDRISEGNLLYTEDPNYPYEERCRAVQEAYPLTAHQETFEYAKPVSFEENVYQCRGERALELEYYDQAISDCNKIIEKNPEYPDAHLNKAYAHMKKGQFESALESFEKYNSTMAPMLPGSDEFNKGLLVGLAKGAAEMTAGIFNTLGDFITHPIDTTCTIASFCYEMAKHTTKGDIKELVGIFAPEIQKLYEDRDTLSEREIGELMGPALLDLAADYFLFGEASAVKGLAKFNKGKKIPNLVKKTEKAKILENLTKTGNVAIAHGTSAERLGSAVAKAAAIEAKGAATESKILKIEQRLIEKEFKDSQKVLEKFQSHTLQQPLKASNGWILPKEGGGAFINGRWYTEHALERMAPRTPEVMAELENRFMIRERIASQKLSQEEFLRWQRTNSPNPRGIPPSVIEAEIAQPGSTGICVILNENGNVITVIPGN